MNSTRIILILTSQEGGAVSIRPCRSKLATNRDEIQLNYSLWLQLQRSPIKPEYCGIPQPEECSIDLP